MNNKYGIINMLILVQSENHSTRLNGINYIFQNKNVNQQEAMLNNIILSIFSNFVPNKILNFQDRDPDE